MRKRLLSLALALVMLLTMIPAVHAADVVASGYCGGEGDGTNLTWELTEDGTLTIEGRGAMKDYYYNSPWNSQRSSVKTAKLGSGVTSIGNYAFYSCSNLTTVKIGGSVKTIGQAAFTGCANLTVVNIPGSVQTIGQSAFSKCANLTVVNIPGSVETIGNDAFNNCSGLTDLVIGDGVTAIGQSAFAGCKNLTKLNIPDRVETIGYGAFSSCTGLTEVTIGDSVKTIGSYAFYNCKALTELDVPDSVTTIDNYAFYECDGLTEITIGNGVTSIGRSAINYCDSLTDVYYYGTKTQWADVEVDSVNGDLNEAELHYMSVAYTPNGDDTHKVVGTCTDCGEVRTRKTAEDCIDDNGNGVCDKCSYREEIPCDHANTTTAIASKKNGTHTTTIICECGEVISQKTTACVDAGNGKCECGYEFPCGHTNTTSAVVFNGDSTHTTTVTCQCGEVISTATADCADNNEDGACDVCGSMIVLASGYCGDEGDGTNLTWVLTKDGTLTIEGKGAMAGYWVEDGNWPSVPWCDYLSTIDKIVIGDGVTNIGFRAFEKCTALVEVKIPDSVTTIDDYAFFDTGLTSLSIPDSVTYIGMSAFSDCENLTAVKIPDSVTNIGDFAFGGCTALTVFEIGSGVKTIGTYVLEGCTSLKTVVTNANPTYGGLYFNYGSTITTVEIGPDVEDVSYLGYSYCDFFEEFKVAEENMHFISHDGVLYTKDRKTLVFCPSGKTESIMILDGVERVEDRAFYECYGLPAVKIPGSVTSIGDWAFFDCIFLTDVYYYGTKEQWTTISVGSDNEWLTGAEIHYMSVGYTPNGDDTHKVVETCTDCGEVCERKTAEDCIDENGDGVCDKCSYREEVPCDHTDTTETVVANGDSTHTTTVTCQCGEVIATATADCADNNEDGACDACGSMIVLASGYCGGEGDGTNLTWVLTEDGTLTIEGEGAMGDYDTREMPWYSCRTDIKAVKLGNGVTTIGSCAFAYCYSLTTVDIGASVTTIGKVAFSNCESLTAVDIGDGVQTIGDYAFSDCDALTTVEIPDSVTMIGACAFYNCDALTTVEIGNGVQTIGDYAFYNCGALTTVEIPDSVTMIGECAFYNCDALTTVEIGNGVQTIDHYAFSSCDALTTVEIGNGVTSIGDSAFEGCNCLETIQVSENNDFYVGENGVLFTKDRKILHTYPGGKKETSYTIPDGVTSIGSSAFFGCGALTTVEIPDSVTMIGERAFYNCDALTTVEIGNGVKSIGRFAFSNCDALTTVHIPDSVTTIGDGAFSNCDALTTVEIGDGVTSIGSYAFRNCSNLTDVYYYGTQEQWADITIGTDNEDLTNAEIHYMEAAYTPNGNKTHTYGDTCTDCGETWGETVVSDCVDEDGDGACDLCGDAAADILASGYCGGEGDGTNLTWVLTKDGTLTIEGEGAMADYNGASPWDSYSGYIKTVKLGDGVTTIGNWAFFDCWISGITIPSGVVTIGDNAFARGGLQEITIPGNVESVGDNAFADCFNLTAVNICDGVKTIGDGAFAGCFGMTTVEIADSVETIERVAFYDCYSLTEITVPGSVTTIGEGAFAKCYKLTDIHMDNSTYQDVDGVLYTKDMKTLVQYPAGKGTASYDIPNSVETIGGWAFCGSRSLTEIEIPDSVTIVGKHAFRGCSLLDRVKVPVSVEIIGDEAFSYDVQAGDTPFAVCYYGTPEQWSEISKGMGVGTPHYMAMAYTSNGDETHMAQDACIDCGKTWEAAVTEECIDENCDLLCDRCEGALVCTHSSGDAKLVYLPNKDMTHTVAVNCGVCAEKLYDVIEAESCTFKNGKCTRCGGKQIEKFTLPGASMTLGNDLKVNFLIKKSDMKDGYVVKVTQEGMEPAEVELTSYNDSYYAASYSVAAKQMTDVLTCQVYDGDGYLVSDPITRTVRQYAMTLLGNSSTKAQLKSVIVDMLNYGTQAQIYFGYSTDDPANAEVSAADQAAYATPDPELDDPRSMSSTCAGTNLALESSILMNAFFKSTTADGMTATISYTDYKGRPVSVEGQVVKASSSMVRVEVGRIVLADAKCPVTVTVYQDGAEFGYCTESVEGYAARNMTNAKLAPLNMTIMKFATSAYNYLIELD